MATQDDLMGVGFAAQQAELIGANPNALTCTGTAQTTAALIKSKLTELVAASSQTGAIFNADAKVGNQFLVNCSSSTAAVVYVPVGHNLNGVANDSLTLAQKKAAIMWQYKKNNWTYVLTA